jgi:uncharacterized sulfatase
MKMWHKGLAGAVAGIAVLAGAAWIFRAELMLWGVERMAASAYEIGPTRPVVWATGADPAGRPPEQRPPNIVLIVADDLGLNDVSYTRLGTAPPTVATPNIDALAAGGVVFRNGYAANGTCAPSRAALMSGRYATRFGFEFTPTPPGFMKAVSLIGGSADRPLAPPTYLNDAEADRAFDDMGMPRSEVTLAEVLAGQGYHAMHIGKWHLGRSPGMAPHERGFDESLLMQSGLYGELDDPEVIQARQDFDPIDRFLWASMRFAARFNGGPVFRPPKYLTDWYTDEAVAAIEANRDRPFFLYLAHWAPHTPLQASAEDYAALEGVEPHRKRVYAAMIRALDRGVGRVMAALREQGLDENTLVLFTSDNGAAGYLGLPAVNDPLRGWKITLFEGGIHVPFVAHWPGRLPAGAVYEDPVHHVDLWATAAAAAGAEPPGDRVIDGVDLVPHVLGERPGPPHEYLFFRSGAAASVRSGPWKLNVSAPPEGGRKEWLFHLEEDPAESRDRLADAPEVVARLRAALAAHDAEQAEPLWPWTLTTPQNVDRDLSQPDQPGDEFAYWSN